MTRAWILPTIALAALPLLGAEEKAKTTETKEQPAATTTTAPAPKPEDSPLVAAARRANRLGKKPTNVITNETLAKSSGTAHVTTAANPLKPINLPPPTAESNPTPEMVAARRAAEERKKAEAAAAAKKKDAEDRRNRVETGARMSEESIEDHYESEAESYKGPEPKADVPNPPPPPPQL